jgi:hypothetical protein
MKSRASDRKPVMSAGQARWLAATGYGGGFGGLSCCKTPELFLTVARSCKDPPGT